MPCFENWSSERATVVRADVIWHNLEDQTCTIKWTPFLDSVWKMVEKMFNSLSWTDEMICLEFWQIKMVRYKTFWAILSHRNIPKTFPKVWIGWSFSPFKQSFQKVVTWAEKKLSVVYIEYLDQEKLAWPSTNF